MVPDSSPRRTTLLRSSLLLATLSGVVTFIMYLLPGQLISSEAIGIIGVGALLIVLLYVAWASTPGRLSDPRRASLRLALVIWWFLLISGPLFSRIGTAESAFEGRFSLAAYGEALIWVLTFLALLLISLVTPAYLRHMFSGPCKWLSLFALVCLLSAAYSPRPLFSFAWAFKLALVALLLQFCRTHIHSLSDIRAFLRATFWAFVFQTLLPLIRAFADPSTAFVGGRLNEVVASPAGFSEVAATLLVLSLTLYSLDGRKWLVVSSILASIVMILAGGKAATIAGIISATLFFLFQKKTWSGLGILAGLSALAAIIILVSPLSSYERDYWESGQGSTLTGRTELWAVTWPVILQNPILGHGYTASRFLSVQVPGTFPEAGHVHNAFLEVLYNNGIVGLILILLMHVEILKSCIGVIRDFPARAAYLLAIGSLAMYVNLVIAGLFNASFGGRAYGSFMLFLALPIIVERLRKTHRTLPAPS